MEYLLSIIGSAALIVLAVAWEKKKLVLAIWSIVIALSTILIGVICYSYTAVAYALMICGGAKIFFGLIAHFAQNAVEQKGFTGAKIALMGAISLIVLPLIILLCFGTNDKNKTNDYDSDYDYSYDYDSDYDYDYDYDYGKGEKYDPDDDLYSDHDYNSDGYINQNEWEDALGDYMDSIMGY